MNPARWLDAPPEPRFTLTVLGDVRVELRARIPERFTGMDADRLLYAPLRPLIAGTAVNFARNAREHFKHIGILGRIGDDSFTPVIRATLRDLGVTDLLHADPEQQNGCSVMLRDPGARLLVASDRGPRPTPEDVRAGREAIASSDLLVADGYALLEERSRAALLEAMALARAHGTPVAFDLVPHDLPDRMALPGVLPALELADVVITEVPTLAGLLEDGARLPERLDTLTAGDPLWLLRDGPTAMEHSLAYRRGRLRLGYPTGFRSGVTERTGFGDRLTASELYWWLSQR
ncbi:carbohydrate kinase family protein [Actinocorallia populi]|uniref:carbohydrate kinase family protein n=1 Tax=Actinocorallia populi TaxID=2079200 RepID=UPI000D0953A5|nr:carbohydrate kinase family protein [Actinocorallia populi]